MHWYADALSRPLKNVRNRRTDLAQEKSFIQIEVREKDKETNNRLTKQAKSVLFLLKLCRPRFTLKKNSDDRQDFTS